MRPWEPGSLTHSLVRSIAPHGHVYTFEFNEVRAEAAAKEIVEHGLTEQCTVTHRDIEADGFPPSLAGRGARTGTLTQRAYRYTHSINSHAQSIHAPCFTSPRNLSISFLSLTVCILISFC